MSILLKPSADYLRLAYLNPRLLTLWQQADRHNRRFGNRYWDEVWYGFGRYPFGFKEQMLSEVGFGAPKDFHEELKTSTAYSTVYQELVALLERSRRATAGTSPWNPDLVVIHNVSDLVAQKQQGVQ